MHPQFGAVCRNTLHMSWSSHKTGVGTSLGYREHPDVGGKTKKVATKREWERIVNDKNHPNEIFITKPNTSYSYNLRSRLSRNTKDENPKTRKLFYGASRKARLFMMIELSFF